MTVLPLLPSLGSVNTTAPASRLFRIGASGVLLLVIGAACSRAPAGWSPVFDRTSTEFLEGPVDEAATGVERALGVLPDEPEVASRELDRAARALERLRTYYVPLLSAREGSYNAYRHLLLGEPARAGEELDRVEILLLDVARTGRHQVAAEMTAALHELEEVTIALDTGDREAGSLLERLAAHLDQLLVKGELVLQGD